MKLKTVECTEEIHIRDLDLLHIDTAGRKAVLRNAMRFAQVKSARICRDTLFVTVEVKLLSDTDARQAVALLKQRILQAALDAITALRLVRT